MITDTHIVYAWIISDYCIVTSARLQCSPGVQNSDIHQKNFATGRRHAQKQQMMAGLGALVVQHDSKQAILVVLLLEEKGII